MGGSESPPTHGVQPGLVKHLVQIRSFSRLVPELISRSSVDPPFPPGHPRQLEGEPLRQVLGYGRPAIDGLIRKLRDQGDEENAERIREAGYRLLLLCGGRPQKVPIGSRPAENRAETPRESDLFAEPIPFALERLERVLSVVEEEAGQLGEGKADVPRAPELLAVVLEMAAGFGEGFPKLGKRSRRRVWREIMGQVERLFRGLEEPFRKAADRDLGTGAWDDLGALREDGHPLMAPDYWWPLAERIAERWRLFGAESKLLRDRAQANNRSREAEKKALGLEGVLLADQQAEQWQKVRLGENWIVDEEGEEAEVVPKQLRPQYQITWLRQTAISAARATLKDEDWPQSATKDPPAPKGDAEAISLAEATRDPISTLFFGGPSADPFSEVLQREVLDLVRGNISAFGEEGQAFLKALLSHGNREEACSVSGVSREAGRQYLARVRRRVRPLL